MYPLVWLIHKPDIHYENGSESDRIVLSEPTLVVSNHISHIDGTIISYVFRKNILRHLAAKDRCEQGGFFGWYLKKSGCIPIDRQAISTQWLHTSINVMKQDGHSIAIYPEGRHGENGQILPFHSGATMIAAFAGVPVVLTYIDGPYRWFRHVDIIASEPFKLPAPPNGLPTADYIAEQTEFLHTRMLELQAFAKARRK